MSAAPLLEVENLEAWYGRVQALHGVSFSMQAGGITTILGANGAGKTTTLRAISRLVKTAGTIRLDGVPVQSLATAPSPRDATLFRMPSSA